MTVSGNTAVALAHEETPVGALLLGEVIAGSDVPAGVVNIVSGRKSELVPVLATPRDVDVLDDGSGDPGLSRLIEDVEVDASLRHRVSD